MGRRGEEMEERKAGCGRVRVDGVRGNEGGVGRAAPLSGWPSSSAASCSNSFFVAGVDRSLPPSASPAASPETSAAELEPGLGEGWSEGDDGDDATIRNRPRVGWLAYS